MTRQTFRWTRQRSAADDSAEADEGQRPSPAAVKIGIMGPFGFGNLGDAAIQEAMIQNIRAHAPSAEICGFSLNPEDTTRRHGIPSYPIGRMSEYGWPGPDGWERLSGPEKFMNRVRFHRNRVIGLFGRLAFSAPSELIALARASRDLIGMDMFVVSGGGQLDDYWGGPWRHPYTLLVWALMAHYRRVPFKIVSVGAGPLDSRLSRLFDRWALALADYRSYRDDDSKRYVAETVGFKRNDPVYPDLAHSLEIDDYTSRSSGDRSHSVVGIGPMTYFDPRIWPQKDQAVYSAYLSKLAAFVAWLLGQGYAVRFFPGEAVHDRWSIDDLCRMLEDMGVSLSDGRVIDEPVETVSDLMEQLAATDLVVASRFHGVLLSLLIRKPVVALSYHRKVDELMKDTGQAAYCLPIDRFEVEPLIERFLDLEANSHEASEQIARRVGQYRAVLDEQYDLIFADL